MMRLIDADHLKKWILQRWEKAYPHENLPTREVLEQIDREISYKMIDIDPQPQWIPVSERLPRAEQEVLICTKKKHYKGKFSGWYEESVITPAIYEDGTILEVDSTWNWYDIDWAGWDEEEDCGIIPEGWWENRHFNPDEVYNNPVDKEVIAWMPLPDPWKGDNNAD